MSQYYKGKRSRNIFDPKSDGFKVSRSGIDLFLNCQKCFYVDKRLGVKRPGGFPFNLNNAVDTLLKKEFDILRAKGKPHPLMKEYKIDAIPFAHEDLDKWRENFVGVQAVHKATGLLITGAVDDVWINPKGELIVVDYKATSKRDEVTLDADWQIGYKRQMEVYQWLLRQNGFKVNNTGYFVYANGDADKEAFDGKLEFDVKVLPYTGDDSWVDGAINDLYKCLKSSKVPKSGEDCDFCTYRDAVEEVIKG